MNKTLSLKVNVTQEHIAKSTWMKICSCPIALAINTPKGSWPLITDTSVHLKDGHLTYAEDEKYRASVYKFQLPENAQAFIQIRDARKPVQPFSFELTAEYCRPLSTRNCTLG